ncbi:MAG: lipid II flippase MurJ [Actinomycetaceae bacterium]|nr:lipid II flippase MurJ [Actinomycetaceae bacterium]
MTSFDKSSGFKSRLRSASTGAVGVIAIATLTSRLVGFIRWLAQSAFVGSGATAGAYASANQIPNIIFEIVVGGALAGITVPLLAAPLARGRIEKAHRVASALLTWVTLILLAVGLAVFFAAGTIAQVLPVPADSDTASQHALIEQFLQIFAWQIPLYGISIVLTGVLQAYKKFLWPAIAPALSSLVVIATFAAYGWLNPAADAVPPHVAVQVLGWGTTAGVAVLSLPLFIPAYRAGFRYRPALYLDSSTRSRAISLGASGLGALLAQQVSVVVGLWLMRSYGQGGTVAVFQYVQAVYWLPYAILAYPVATAVFPVLSEQGEAGCSQKFKATCAYATKRVSVAALVGVALLVVMAPVAHRFFELLTPVPGMASALIVMAPALFGFSLLFYGQRVLYALSFAGTAWRVAAGGWVTVAVAQVVAVLLFAPGGADGPGTLRAIAGGHTVGMSVAAIATLVAIRRAAGADGVGDFGRVVKQSAPVLLLATLLASGVTWWISGLGASTVARLVAVVGAAGAGLAVLAGVIIVFGRRTVVRTLRMSYAQAVSAADLGDESDDR